MKISAPGLSLTNAAPTNSAEADVATVGTGALASRDDHKHGRESFAVPAVVLGTAAAAGVATTPMRSDATIVAFDVTAPSTLRAKTAAVVGVVAAAARRDHNHDTQTLPGWEKVSAGAISSASSLDLTGLAGYKRYRWRFIAKADANSTPAVTLQINGDVTNGHYTGNRVRVVSTVVTGQQDSTTFLTIVDTTGGGANRPVVQGLIDVQLDTNVASWPQAVWQGGGIQADSSGPTSVNGHGALNQNVASITSLKLSFGTAVTGYYVLEGSND